MYETHTFGIKKKTITTKNIPIFLSYVSQGEIIAISSVIAMTKSLHQTACQCVHSTYIFFPPKNKNKNIFK